MERTVIIEFDSVEHAIAADETPAYQEALSPSPTVRINLEAAGDLEAAGAGSAPFPFCHIQFAASSACSGN